MSIGSKEFQVSSRSILEMLKKMSDMTDKERMEVIGKRSRLLIETTERGLANQRLKAQLIEKENHMERLNLQHESLMRIEQENEETLLWLAKK